MSGRVATRFLLLYGKTLIDMQIMQITYAVGTAAENVFSAYIYHVFPSSMYQEATRYVQIALLAYLYPMIQFWCVSYTRASQLLSTMVSGILGDILVIQFDVDLTALFYISAVSVTAGIVIGYFSIIRLQGETRSIEEGRTWYEYTAVCYDQYVLMKNSLSSIYILTFTIWWIVGNAIWMTLYDYEVSLQDILILNHSML